MVVVQIIPRSKHFTSRS